MYPTLTMSMKIPKILTISFLSLFIDSLVNPIYIKINANEGIMKIKLIKSELIMNKNEGFFKMI